MSAPHTMPTLEYGRNTNMADVLIIGAGLSGMTTAIEMIRKGQGRNFIIVEKGNQVGGTWNDQRYPGCCCVCYVPNSIHWESNLSNSDLGCLESPILPFF